MNTVQVHKRSGIRQCAGTEGIWGETDSTLVREELWHDRGNSQHHGVCAHLSHGCIQDEVAPSSPYINAVLLKKMPSLNSFWIRSICLV